MNQEFTKEILQQNESFICEELNLNRGVQDMLFEFEIISIEDHDVIDNQPRRTEKRKLIVELLFRKENIDWIPGFIQILFITGHTHVLEYIRSQLNMVEGIYSLYLSKDGDIDRCCVFSSHVKILISLTSVLNFL